MKTEPEIKYMIYRKCLHEHLFCNHQKCFKVLGASKRYATKKSSECGMYKIPFLLCPLHIIMLCIVAVLGRIDCTVIATVLGLYCNNVGIGVV